LLERFHSEDGRLLALVPLYLWRSFPLRILRFVGHGPSDALGPVCAPEHRSAAAGALRTWLAGERFDAFIGEELPADHGWADALGARVLRRRASPVIRLEGLSWEEFLASRSSNQRADIRRDERRLAKQGLHYRLANDRERLQADLDTLFQLHQAGFPRGTSDFGWDVRLQAFHREFAAAALARGWLRLWFLELDGQPVASWYGFRFENADYHYQGGRDPAWNRWSVGKVLLAHTIRTAFEDRIGEYRLLRGGEGYKSRFASEDPGVETVVLTPALAARAALAIYYRGWKLRRMLAHRKLRALRDKPVR
jgi:CelD/BcsL family acetyltransferase involved in cellulose biosynthesis